MSKKKKGPWSTPVRSKFKTRANQLGLQVFRVMGFELKYRLRRLFLSPRSEKSNYTKDFERDGYIVIPDFLSPEDYARLKDHYYERLKDLEKPTNEGPKLVAPPLCDPKDGTVDPLIEELFVKNNTINEVVENASAHRQHLLPLIRMHHYWAEESDLGLRETARTDELHYDVPLRNFRAFFYLEDCDKSNAAFEFAPGTHKFNMKRLYMEYRDSIVQAKARQGKPHVKVQPIQDDLLKLLDAKPIPLEAPGNSLIIFNTMGLHRRGRFSHAGTREALLLDFRFLDAPANYKAYGPPLKWF